MTYVPWLGSPEHAEAEQVHDLLLSVSDEAAMDSYNAMKASYLDKAEAEIERLTRPAPAPSVAVSDMLNQLRAAPKQDDSIWNAQVALAINLLEMDGEQVELDSWPAAQEFILHILNALPKE